MKNWKYIFIVSILFSCSESKNQNEEYFKVDYSETGLNSSNELFFQGNKIILEEIADENNQTSEKKYLVQKIENTIGDITFRAKRIPTELYLKNQGVNAGEIELALSDLKDEQLFYFEFEEIQKQDLIKKYFKENTDQKISYLAFDIFNDFKAINESGDTINAEYSLYERNFHVAPFERVLLSFKGVTQNENLKLIYSDKLFGKGTSQFSFASSTYLQNNTKQPS